MGEQLWDCCNCGGSISKHAEVCPKCGHPYPTVYVQCRQFLENKRETIQKTMGEIAREIEGRLHRTFWATVILGAFLVPFADGFAGVDLAENSLVGFFLYAGAVFGFGILGFIIRFIVLEVFHEEERLRHKRLGLLVNPSAIELWWDEEHDTLEALRRRLLAAEYGDEWARAWFLEKNPEATYALKPAP